MPRLFFALWPDPETRNKLAIVANKTGLTTGKPVPINKLHLTVAFLGSVDTIRLEQLLITAVTVSNRRFSLLIDHFGWWKQSRIFWLAPGQTPDALLELHSGIASLAGDCGITVESRAYLPHITLARNVNTPVSIEFEPIQWDVSDLCLLETITQPGDTEYKIIQRWPLT